MVDAEWEKKRFWTGKTADRVCIGHGVVPERKVIRDLLKLSRTIQTVRGLWSLASVVSGMDSNGKSATQRQKEK